MVLRGDPMQSLDEAIAMWIDVAKASEDIDGTWAREVVRHGAVIKTAGTDEQNK